MFCYLATTSVIIFYQLLFLFVYQFLFVKIQILVSVNKRIHASILNNVDLNNYDLLNHLYIKKINPYNF